MDKQKIKKIYLIVLALYVAIVTSFYFVAGEQLWYKESAQNGVIVEADSVTEEINRDTVIEQKFVSTVDKLDSLAIVFTKNYQEGEGILIIDLLDGGFLLARKQIGVKDVPEQHRLYLEPVTPIKGLNNKTLTLRIYANSEVTKGVRVMMNSRSNSIIKINDSSVAGTMCFSISGLEEISYSSYYWFIVGGMGILLAIILFVSYKNYLNNKYDYIVNLLLAIEKYNFLIKQLISKDFKTKYKRSILGVFWSFLNPLLTMTVQFLVFSTIFKADARSYPVYLLSGVVCFNFFKEASEMCLQSISSNASLINKVYIPKYLFPLSKLLSSLINLGISLIPLFVVSFISGMGLHLSTLLSFHFLVCLALFSFGIGLFLSALMVFFRDIQFLWSVFIQMWQYATPIFYSAEIIPDKFRFIVRFNPLYHFIGNFRKCLMNGVSPEPMAYVYCLVFALISLLVGITVFKKTQDRFTLYL